MTDYSDTSRAILFFLFSNVFLLFLFLFYFSFGLFVFIYIFYIYCLFSTKWTAIEKNFILSKIS